METVWWWLVVCGGGSMVGLVLVGYLVLVLITFLLASIAWWRGLYRKSKSAIYVGRVWHTRYQPTHHGFSYPIFVACIDLTDDNDGDFNRALYPLSCLMSLHPNDHYKNGEGLDDDNDDKTAAAADNKTSSSLPSLAQRTLCLVNQHTQPQKQPLRQEQEEPKGNNNNKVYTRQTHSVKLVTHLRYYGYCFNPVSFYYIVERSTGRIDAVVGEVSNTPWNEMQCYVLHPNSSHVASHRRLAHSTNYVFSKTFHVSPFMEMHHTYDWTFWDFVPPTHQDTTTSTTTTAAAREHSFKPLRVTCNMIKKKKTKQEEDGTTATTTKKENGLLWFSARLVTHHGGLHPFSLAVRLVLFPVFCAVIQVWIHYEALWLFLKGVAYVPHPNDTETTASRIIGNIMVPFFAMKDCIDCLWSSKDTIKG